jgi:hypothetical protein
MLNRGNDIYEIICNGKGKKYSCEKYKSNDNLLHSLMKEN